MSLNDVKAIRLDLLPLDPKFALPILDVRGLADVFAEGGAEGSVRFCEEPLTLSLPKSRNDECYCCNNEEHRYYRVCLAASVESHTNGVS